MSDTTITQNDTPTASAAGPMQMPAPGVWQIDAAHTLVGFSARHLGVAKVRGQFRSFEGTVVIGEDPTRSQVSVTIDASSIDTREPSRDAHLRSADFLDVDNHPTLTFSSTAVRADGDRWKVDGDLTIRGTTRPVTLDVELLDVVTNEAGDTKAVFSANTEIDRTDFGLTWNQVLDAGRLLVGKRVGIELDVQLQPTS